ncbi:MAG TPA: AAA family ATPase [Terriglobia bacterium]|nr:AAA family ATPase [Terriglobia bacterium]
MTTKPTTHLLSLGSEWRKWDLHIHSPLSGLNNQFPPIGNGQPDWQAYIGKLESLGDIPVIGITDYFTIEGYRKVCDLRSQERLKNITLVLPNIEFRLDKIITTSKGPRRLNYHVIFSDKVTADEVEEHFLQELKFCFEGDPQRTDLSWSIRRSNLELLGSRLKKEHKTFDDHRSDFEIGYMNATVDPGKIKEVLQNKERIFRGKYLIVLAEEHTPLLDWDGQDHLARKVLLQGADAIFSANPKTAYWARGEGDLSTEQFRFEFKTLKPCLHGSDAHRLDDIGCPAESRYCWIKAEPTFEGLKQVLYEPRERVFIGDQPPKLKNDYQIIESIQVSAASDWFEPVEIPLNQDLVAIIGPRGSGKSALAEMLAFAGGAVLFRLSSDIQDTFLYKASQKTPANPAPITGATLSLHWKNGDVDNATVPANLRHDKQEEKVKYLPQKFVERLCAPENNRQLEQEMERVIFQRIAKTERLEASNFQELRQASTRTLDLKRKKLTRTIQDLDQSIADTSARIGAKSIKENELKRKRQELTALQKNVPKVPPENKEELRRLDELTKQRQELEQQVVGYTEQSTALNAIEARFEILKEDITSFNSEVGELLEKAELGAEKEKFEVRLPSEVPTIIARRHAELASMIGGLRKGSEDAPTALSLERISRQIDEIKAQSQLTAAKQKEYEKFQRDRKVLDDAISSLERDIKEIEDVLTPRVKQENEARVERYLDSFELLKEEKAILEKLYEPLRTALLSSNETAKKLMFVSKTTFDVARHTTRGMELLDRRKAVYREQEDLENALKSFFRQIEDADFDRDKAKKALVAFRDSFLVHGETKVRIEDQIRRDRTGKEFADWFYSIDDFSVTYSITFDGKDLQFLSPGDKGIVLLLLYLEAENEDNRPLIIDQPDDNLDNVSVYPSLTDYFRSRKKARQIIIITHNPNLVVNTDAEQVFVANFDATRVPKLSYRSGALEDTNPGGPVQGIREDACKILEGGTEAFQLREQRYALSGL